MLAGGFAFGEGCVAVGEDDESVWHSGCSGGDEFVAFASRCCDGSGEGLFDAFFSHVCSFSFWLVYASRAGVCFAVRVEQLLSFPIEVWRLGISPGRGFSRVP